MMYKFTARAEKAIEIANDVAMELGHKYIGTEQKVLIEGFSKNNEKMYTARTDTNKVVVFKPTENEKIGDIVKVKILSAHKWYLEAEIIDERG